ncbi:MAG: hypothetical protein K0R80_158 [Clostridia bacterium]|jgi:hypothetical protein|nr:hypothetical protein [Clostridia bacterium]
MNMKVDFNKNGMTLNFEKVPRFIYINEEGNGVGQVYLDGVRKKGLQKVKFEAQTKDKVGCHPLKYKIQYVEPETKGEPQYIGNMQDGLSVSIKITDLEVFERLMEWAKGVLSDERIPKEPREEFFQRLNEVINHETITMHYGDGKKITVITEGIK